MNLVKTLSNLKQMKPKLRFLKLIIYFMSKKTTKRQTESLKIEKKYE